MLQQEFVHAVEIHDIDTVERLLCTDMTAIESTVKVELGKLVRNDSPILKAFERAGLTVMVLTTAAAETGSLNVVQALVTRHPELTLVDINRIFSEAAHHNHLDIAQWFVEHTPVTLTPALIIGVCKNYSVMVSYILNHPRIDPTVDLNRILTIAVIYEHLEIAQQLVVCEGINIREAIRKAAMHGSARVLDWLLHQYTFDNIQVLLDDVIRSESIDTVKVVLKHGGVIDTRMVNTASGCFALLLIGVYFVLNHPLTPEQITIVVDAVNTYTSPRLAVNLIRHHFATIGNFHLIAFSHEDLRELILDRIVAFPSYEDIAANVRCRLLAEALFLGEYLPSVLVDLTIKYA